MNKNLAEALSIIRCPLTGSQLRELHNGEIENINKRIVSQQLRHYNGELVSRSLTAGLITLDGECAYFVEDEIPVMLANVAILLKKIADDKEQKLHEVKNNMKKFYDEVGWQQDDKHIFTDAARFEDLRAVSREYISNCHGRVKRYLKPAGKYILDVASGPLQYPEYLTYSESYKVRVCMDISIVALKRAKEVLKERGIYILADITKLPLIDNSMDAVLSLHTIYHVPQQEQKRAFQELYRVLKRESSAVIVYSWGNHSLLMNFSMFPFKLLAWLKRTLTKVLSAGKSVKTELYFHPYSYRWFSEQFKDYDCQIVSWRSVSTTFQKVYIHSLLLGKQLLKLIYRWEEKYPSMAGKIGQYPLIIFKKQDKVN